MILCTFRSKLFLYLCRVNGGTLLLQRPSAQHMKPETKQNRMNKQQAAVLYLRSRYVEPGNIRHDTVTNRLQIRKQPPDEHTDLLDNPARGTEWQDMTTQDINSIVCACAAENDIAVSGREMLTALQSDIVPDVHPIRAWLDGCPRYNPVVMPDFIGMLSGQVHIADPTPERQRLWDICFKKWFVAMVASWLDDAVVNHQVLVLIGKQGIYKTTWLEHLLPPALRVYCSKLANTRDMNRDERLRIAESALINLDEIDSMNPRELNQLKSLITASDVNERAAYAYTKERRVRLASFCASGNRSEFLSDTTGNRRWLPFEIESIDSPFSTGIPYDLVYAQAVYTIRSTSFPYWFDLDEIDLLEQHNDRFRAKAGEEELLPLLFGIPAEGLGEFLTTAQISERLTTYGNIKQPMPLNRLGMLLGKMGYYAARKRTESTVLRGWLVAPRSADELKLLRKNDVEPVETMYTSPLPET